MQQESDLQSAVIQAKNTSFLNVDLRRLGDEPSQQHHNLALQSSLISRNLHNILPSCLSSILLRSSRSRRLPDVQGPPQRVLEVLPTRDERMKDGRRTKIEVGCCERVGSVWRKDGELVEGVSCESKDGIHVR